MDMIKYIVKRLLLSVLILFGVSVIIYSLARMMPTDYVDNQYSSAVSQGTMRHTASASAIAGISPPVTTKSPMLISSSTHSSMKRWSMPS